MTSSCSQHFISILKATSTVEPRVNSVKHCAWQVLNKWCFRAMFRTGSQDLRWLSLPLSIHHLHKQQRRRCGWEWQPRDLFFFWGGGMFWKDLLNKQICVFFANKKGRDHMHVIDDTLTPPTPWKVLTISGVSYEAWTFSLPSTMRHDFWDFALV